MKHFLISIKEDIDTDLKVDTPIDLEINRPS